jgi:hypothetical protein
LRSSECIAIGDLAGSDIVLGRGPRGTSEAEPVGTTFKRMVMYSILNENVQSTVAAGTVRGIKKIPDRKMFLREKLVPVLARELVSDVLHQFHDAPEAGHMGVRTKLRKEYFGTE